jgi:hypothetical protein
MRANPAMTLAAVNRLVHHATILELNVESYRRAAPPSSAAGTGPTAITRDNQAAKPL